MLILRENNLLPPDTRFFMHVFLRLFEPFRIFGSSCSKSMLRWLIDDSVVRFLVITDLF